VASSWHGPPVAARTSRKSAATTPAEIVVETARAEMTERGATRMDDRTSDASMERRKKEGYF